jgi:cyclic beta-1,2-glucan synthetase
MPGTASAAPPAAPAASTEVFIQPFDVGPIRAEVYGLERLESHARALAAASLQVTTGPTPALLARLRDNGRVLHKVHRQVAELARRQESLTPDAEWLLDNFFIIEGALREVQHDLPRGYYAELPRLETGPLAGLPRVYALALGLIAHTDSGLNDEQTLQYVRAYQTVAPLTIGELWAVPTMLRLALIENLRRLADQLLQTRAAHAAAAAWVNENVAHAPRSVLHNDPFLVGLIQVLRDQGTPTSPAAEWLEVWLNQQRLTVPDVLRREHQRQAANQVSIGNAVTSLRLLGVLDWYEFFEQASVTEAVLRGDPTGLYPHQDFATRDRCRRAVERLARGSRHPEEEVARLALEHAASAPPEDVQRSHLSYYLIGDGLPEFEAELGYRPALRDWLPALLTRHPNTVYFGGLLLLLAGLVAALVAASGAGWPWQGLLVLAAVLLPASDLAVGVLHAVLTRLLPPRVLPKLDFKDGIPPECSTFVVIPSLLNSADGVARLLQRLELHYLSNPDPQLRFALLTDFADAPEERMPEDETLVHATLEGVRALNERHAARGPERFFLFHRRRLWNPAQRHWMGWERKRGKLQEFARLLRGDHSTSYAVTSVAPRNLPHVRYLLTLDADTRLPHEAARRLIGTLAHPLNQPRFDPQARRVVAGYGVLQPRVSFLYRTGKRSLFARVFAYSAGVDPYSSAVSDAYQDLLGEGTYTGKGLHDIDAFDAATAPAFPDNHILSHDLIEGNFARCGLVTDVEFFDDFPARYNTYARREHRWVRGDWQLLPWLGWRVPANPEVETGREGEAPAEPASPARGAGGSAGASPSRLPAQPRPHAVPNPLTPLGRWKVLDNLRRSLVPAAVVLLLVLGWTVLPGSPWLWTGVGLAVIALPLLLQLAGALLDLLRGAPARAVGAALSKDLPTTAGQVLLSFTFLLFQAGVDLHAIGITLYRLLFSRRDLLEWETAAAAEQRLGADLRSFLSSMWPSSAVAAVLAVLVAVVAPWSLPAALPVALLWFLAPLVAWRVSQPLPSGEVPLTEEERQNFRQVTRRTWGFFETFVGDADHWLPPDNYQETPKATVAHRTSPTNIGLLLLSTLAAHDLGYLSLQTLAERLAKTFATLARLERYHNHFLNWYDTQTLQPLQPGYVSTVDSGNLLGCLLALANGLHEKQGETIPSPAAAAGLADALDLATQELTQAQPGKAAGRPAWQAAGEAAAEAEGILAGLPVDDLLAHDDALSRLEGSAAALSEQVRELVGHLDRKPEALLRWTATFLAQVRDQRAELAELAPWLELLRGNGPWPEPAPKWLEFRRALTAPLSLEDWDRRRAEHLAEVAGWSSGQTGLLGQLAAAVEKSKATELAGRLRTLAGRARALADAMDFRFLYNPQRDLFAIGFNLALGRLDNSYYDLLASEACLISFLAVARGEVPRKHWFQLGRLPTFVAGKLGLLSWGGTMFEYLMPRLLLSPHPGTLLDETRAATVARQIEYGRENKMPWGISESAFNVLDAAQDYQYQSFGVPGLGLKRGLALDLVVAPYATMLAVSEDAHAAASNLDALRAIGATGSFGFYESIDFTPSRLVRGERYHIIRSYMAHHQGMGLVALANRLLGDVMPRRLRAEPHVRATELLLEERLPLDVPPAPTTDDDADMARVSSPGTYPTSRRIRTPHTPSPRTHLLSNGRYTVMLTNAGAGFSACAGLAVSRWREDRTTDSWGPWCYVRDLDTGAYWSAGYKPVGHAAAHYQVDYSIDKAEIRRLDGDLETVLEVVVSPEKDVEVRRLALMNHGRRTRNLELTSYVEVVLAPPSADLAHPAFHKLFLQTEWLPGLNALLCRRRPRSAEQAPVWAVHVLAGEGGEPDSVEFETDRMRFLGRRRTVAHPAALEPGAPPLSGTTGPVLDPIFSLRQRVTLHPGEVALVAFSTGVAATRDEAQALADEFRTLSAVTRVFDLAWAHSRVELRHLGLSVEDAHLFQRLAGHVLFAGPALRSPPEVLAANARGQSGLWRLGISGDVPIVLVRIAEGRQRSLVKQALQAHAYWRAKGLVVDLVVLNEDASGYLDEVHDDLQALVRTTSPQETEHPGGVFVRKGSHLSEADRTLLLAAARVVLVGDNGPLANQVDILERRPSLPHRLSAAGLPEGKATAPEPPRPRPADLLFDNGTGGFSSDGREYVISCSGVRSARPPAAGQVPPAPWVNVVANPVLGFLVSDSSLGCTWAGNSQSNRLTPWNNDPVSDPPAEAVYLRDEQTGEFWSATPLPDCGHGLSCMVRHGAGYSVFEQSHTGLDVGLRVWVAAEDPVKFLRLTVRNRGHARRRLSATLYAEWVLGTVREQTAMHVVTEIEPDTQALFARNAYNADFGGEVAFADVDQRPRTLTGDRTEFLGRDGSAGSPAALKRQELSGHAGAGLDPCAALQVKFDLAPGAEHAVLFLLGQAENRNAACRLIKRVKGADSEVVRWRGGAEGAGTTPPPHHLTTSPPDWERLLTTIQVRTPDPAFDLLLNRWLLCQVLASRFWGRTAFYQSSGAYGFRDQLQDAMALVYAAPAEARAHLLRAAGRLFEEGDCQHWWHPPSGVGVRTRFSDDYLWLPFVVHQYVTVTGDTSVLDEKVHFLHAPPLAPTVEEVYSLPGASPVTASLYEHCCRALEHGWNLGPHGLPLMGTGDWNDGMNRVGTPSPAALAAGRPIADGKGESVWVGWFLLTCLRNFAELADARKDADHAAPWRQRAEQLRVAIEQHAWDGAWYRRAYFDDGTPLGSATNDECQIDSIVQTWAVISGAADPERSRQAMDAVMQRLVKSRERLILLLDPPFDKGPLQPGYIKGYVPGIRENGGQYTHASTWVVQALALLGRGAEAVAAFDLLNPVRRTTTPEETDRYRVEPYVLPGDVYSQPPHVGRGGWTWYTGSAAWLYRIGLEHILGFRKRGDRLRLAPCLRPDWTKFEITYLHGATVFHIICRNAHKLEHGTSQIWLDGVVQPGDEITLVDDGGTHEVRVELT